MLVAGANEGGLRALERTTKVKGEDRFYLTIKQTLSMYHGDAPHPSPPSAPSTRCGP